MNSFGKIFRLSLYGESHGSEIGIIIDGCPPGISLCKEDFINDLQRRSSKNKKAATTRLEDDIPEIKSGVYNNKTQGTPIAISFKNKDVRTEDYKFDGFFRPGHSDFAANKKHKGYNNPEGSGHYSGRLTVLLVAAGVIAKKIIQEVKIKANIVSIGGQSNYDKLLEDTAKEKDSLGGIIKCTISNLPAGIGEPFFYSIESAVSSLVFSIPGAKAVEFGEGIKGSEIKGSQYNDMIINSEGKTSTNNTGGINAGISNGNDIYFKVYFRPPASIGKTQKTYNFKTDKIDDFKISGRHDVCYVLRTEPIVEAVAAIAIADLLLLS